MQLSSNVFYGELPFNRAPAGEGFVMSAFPAPAVESPDALCIAVRGNELLVERTGDAISFPCSLPSDIAAPAHRVCFGRWNGKPLNAYAVPGNAPTPPGMSAEPFNAADDNLDHSLLTVAGIGRQVLHWIKTSSYCSACGSGLSFMEGTWGKSCGKCRREYFPHVSPCAIVLVRRGDELLLVRKKDWIAGRYSLVAGFVEMGESLEECAIRETREETGIETGPPRFVGSQNWPFPSQLMAGFVAEYRSGEIAIDRDELEDARWFTPDSLPLLPSARSIARRIIDDFGAGS